MRQAIMTKYLGPSNHKGSRVKAWCEAKSITLHWDDALGVDDNHYKAARVLAARMGWLEQNEITGGSVPRGGYCFLLTPKSLSWKRLAASVLEWAAAPGDHGGNPYLKPFVRMAMDMAQEAE